MKIANIIKKIFLNNYINIKVNNFKLNLEIFILVVLILKLLKNIINNLFLILNGVKLINLKNFR
jgi:hypothetical protein